MEEELALRKHELALKERELELDRDRLKLEREALKFREQGESRRKSSVAIWIAVVGAIVTSFGYLVGFYQSLSLQKSSQNHALLVDLLSENPNESTDNLIWAYEANLLSLSKETVSALQADPSSAPTRAASSIANVAFDELVPTNDVVALVRGLDDPARRTRAASLQALLDGHSANERAIKAAIDGISGTQLKLLSANGRVNILYFLERAEWCDITAQGRTRARTAVKTIIQRADEGIAAAGAQTRGHTSAIIASIEKCEE